MQRCMVGLQTFGRFSNMTDYIFMHCKSLR